MNSNNNACSRTRQSSAADASVIRREECMEDKKHEDITGKEVVLFIMRIVLAAPLSFLVARLNCSLLHNFELRAFDFVCGHNAYFQLPALFVVLIVVLGWVPPFRKLK
jgi:hypothetical protein